MTSRLSPPLIVRVRRCGRSVAELDASLVFQLSGELGITLEPLPDGRLHVEGDREAVLFLGPALRAHKAALLRGVCVRCRHNLATTDDGQCEACASLPLRWFSYVPGSALEQTYLDALAARGIQ